MPAFTETERPLSLNDIAKIERLVGLDFPAEYQQHLLLHNGGRCHPNIFKYVNGERIDESDVDWFLAIYNGEDDNLLEYIKWYKFDIKRLPTSLLPIAHDSGGNLICISCGTVDNGSIYFWDHENEVDYSISDDTDYSNLYLVATKLSEFLDGLRPLQIE